MKSEKIIIIAVSGIGNAILFTPTLVNLRKKFPKSRIVIFSRNKAIADIFEGSGYADKIITFDNYNIIKRLQTLIKIRSQKFDYSITAFPSNKFQFNILAFIIGARKRITHK